jgi:hypothetical protein
LASTAARLLVRFTSLMVLAPFRGGGASCDDIAGSGGAGCGDWVSWASRLAWLMGGSNSWSRWDLVDNGEFPQAATCIIQHPRPATIVHALVVYLQKARGD